MVQRMKLDEDGYGRTLLYPTLFIASSLDLSLLEGMSAATFTAAAPPSTGATIPCGPCYQFQGHGRSGGNDLDSKITTPHPPTFLWQTMTLGVCRQLVQGLSFSAQLVSLLSSCAPWSWQEGPQEIVSGQCGRLRVPNLWRSQLLPPLTGGRCSSKEFIVPQGATEAVLRITDLHGFYLTLHHC